MALAQSFFLASPGTTISYSDFKQAVRGGAVAEVNSFSDSVGVAPKLRCDRGRNHRDAPVVARFVLRDRASCDDLYACCRDVVAGDWKDRQYAPSLRAGHR